MWICFSETTSTTQCYYIPCTRSYTAVVVSQNQPAGSYHLMAWSRYSTTCTTGGACKGPQTLGKGFVEGCPRQRPLGEFLDDEGVFADTRQSLCRGPGRPSAKKRSRQAPTPLTVSLPRADPRQRNGFFLNFFCRGPALGKEFF